VDTQEIIYNALTLMFHNEGINVKEAKVVEALTKLLKILKSCKF
jgi:hypothetical protein